MATANKLLLLLVTVIATSLTLIAQEDLDDSPLTPSEGFRYRGYLGVTVGVGPNIQSGDMRVNCNSCLFDNGRKTGYSIGLNYEHYFLKEFSAGVGVKYDDYSFTAKYREISNREFTPTNSNRSVRLPLELQQTADLSLSLLSIMPYARYRPFELLSFRVGAMPAFGSPSLTHTEEVVNTIQNIGGQIYVISQPNPNENLDSGETPPDAAMIHFFGVIGIDTHVWIRYDLNFNAGIEWRQPFTNFDFYQSDFQIFGPRVTIGLEYLFYREIK